MVATRPDKSRALAALTSAALGLPGIHAHAAVPAAQAQGNVQYGYYQESDDRMNVEIYHGDFTLPVSDRLEFTFSVDRDTYSGATPAFSMPTTMTEQPLVNQTEGKADVISAASGEVYPALLTTFGLNTFQEVYTDLTTRGEQIQALSATAAATLNAQKIQTLNAYVAANPNPGLPATISGPVTLNFQGIASAVYGKANLNTGSFCPGGTGCFEQNDIIVGTISDPLNNNGHLHRQGGSSDREVQYHADSSGIYIRALNGEAFSASNLIFNSLLSVGNGPNDFWEILGFNTAVNPSLSTGDGTNYATRVAYQPVSINQTGVLSLDNAFSNINALWIHYKGYFQDILNSGVDFEVRVDDINLAPTQFSSLTPAQIAWLAAYNNYRKSVDQTLAPQYANIDAQAKALQKQAIISVYRDFLNKQVPVKTQTKQVMQTQPVETRTQPTFGAKYYFDDTTLALSGGQSTEPDFISTFGSAKLSHELNNKLTTLTAGYSASSNEISRNTGGHSAASHAHDVSPEDNPAIYPVLKQTSNYNTFDLGLSQILNKNALLQFSANYTRQNGYLNNPYKYVYVRGEITAEEYYQMFNDPQGVNWNDVTKLEVAGIDLFREVRPDQRNQFSFSTRLNQYLPALDATVHLDYRYYFDDWDINSHTVELKWFQKLPWGLTLTPSLRYYSQSQADFFAPYFLAPRDDGHYSSDFRLSGYGALSSGLTVSKQFNRGIRLEMGMEYYTHQGDLKLGGGGESNYADFNYWMTHANLNIDLSAPGHMFGSGAGDEHHHQHHGAPAPAGIMYGHMMPQADDIMVGYRYAYANQDGEMMHNSSSANDATIRAAACGGAIGCSERPTEMAMHMHMLELMYAPTNWLNLMLMPQLMDMNMELAPLDGVTEEESQHGGGHKVHALGDTIVAGMVKVFDTPGHDMHVSTGFSAPTGSVEETMDGQNNEDSLLQDYGMQPGSGTWDFIPSLTYAGHTNGWSWGTQISGTKRLQNKNKAGYALGDRFQATAWGGYSFTDWFSTSIRGVYSQQGKIRGEFNRPHSNSAPVDYTANSGGQFVDVGIGLNLSVPNGAFTGHNISVEWLQPVADKFNGYQLEREGSLFATWNYVF